jgi:hypothetical protein
MKKWIILIGFIIVTSIFHYSHAAEYYVATDGLPTAAGTIENPLDLTTALTSGNSPAQPGDIIYLRGGTYTPYPINIDISGTQSMRITIMPYNKEKAIIDGINGYDPGQESILKIDGDHITLKDLIITCSDTDLWSDTCEDSPSDVNVKAGIYTYGEASHIINCVIYNNTGNGIGSWTGHDCIVYGNIIFNNGWGSPCRGMGHGIYFRSAGESKLIKDNIFFNAFANGIDGYMGNGQINDCDVIGNVTFNAGACSHLEEYAGALFMGGSSPLFDVRVNENIVYQDVNNPYKRAKSAVHFGMSSVNYDIEFHDNNVVGGSTGMTVQVLDVFDLLHNYIVSDPYSIFHNPPHDNGTSNWLGDNNDWYSLNASGYFIDGEWSGWQARGLDANGIFIGANPTKNKVIIRPNEYEAKRAHITVFNWEELDSVEVDLSGILDDGDQYVIYDVENLFTILVSGTYHGQVISLPMNMTDYIKPNGDLLGPGGTPVTLLKTETVFNTFLLTTWSWD